MRAWGSRVQMKCEVHWVRSQFINHISHSLSSFVVHYSVDSCDIPLSVGLLFKQNRVVYVSIACACVCVISGVWLHMWYMQPNSWLFICWYYRMIFRYCACCCKITGAIIMYGTFSGRSHVHIGADSHAYVSDVRALLTYGEWSYIFWRINNTHNERDV